HRRTGGKLEGDDYALLEYRISPVDDCGSVELDDNVIPLGGDLQLVPVPLMDQGFGLLRGIALQDLVSTMFLVEYAPVAVGDVGLGTVNDAFGGAVATEL